MGSPVAPSRPGLLNQPGRPSVGAEFQDAPPVEAWDRVSPHVVNPVQISREIPMDQLSAEVEKLVDNMTPGSNAHELFQGDRVSKKSFRDVQDLADIFATMALVPDSSTMHNVRWLQQRSDELASFINDKTTPFATQEDRDAIERIKRRIDSMLNEYKKEVDQDVRRKEDIQHAKTGQESATWSRLELLMQDPSNVLNRSPELAQVKAVVEGLIRTKGKDATDEENFKDVAAALQKKRKDLVDRMNQTGTKAQQEAEVRRVQALDEQLQETLGAVARAYAETFVTGRGRLNDKAYNRRTGEYNEALVHELQSDEGFRDYWFYHILDPIIKNPRLETHRDLVSLQVISDLEIFMDIVKDAKNDRGELIGNKLVNYYTMLKNMIYQTHDMDYYAAHPAQDIKEFSQSTAFFTNRYIDFGFQHPMVALAKRMYEVALLQIREDHGGYIPRRYLEWTADNQNIELDERVKKLVMQAVQNNQYYAPARDPVSGLPDRDRWMRIQQGQEILSDAEKAQGKIEPYLYTVDDLYGGKNARSTDWSRELGDLRIAAATKMAKGLALVDMRFLEILARSKGSGGNIPDQSSTNFYSFGGKGFGSVPYENLVKHIEPMIHYYGRFEIGTRNFLPFFNMLITDNPNWNPQQIREILKLAMDGDHKELREKYGDTVDTKLLLTDNPFSFSGMWGTMTGWRNGMSSEGWDDWERERFSTANKLSFVGDSYIRFADDHGHMHSTEHGSARHADGLAKRKVKEYFLLEDDRYADASGMTARKLYVQLRNKYRERLLRSNAIELISTAQNDVSFERRWRTVGMEDVDPDTNKSYKKQLEERWKNAKGRYEELKSDHKQRELQMKLERAYKARIWVQAAMRNPLAVAREMKSDEYDIAGHTRKRELRDKIIWEILHIDTSKFHDQREPSLQEFEETRRITDLEGALASMTQKAVRENRDLTEADFNDIDSKNQNSALRRNALQYWRMVRQEMLGHDEAGNIRNSAQWYRKIGIENADPNGPVGHRLHRINWNVINNDISLHGKWDDHHGIFHHKDPAFHSRLLTARTIDRDWRYLFSTEDMGWEYLNVPSLGERNPVRRAGDLGSHAAFHHGLDKLLGPGGAIGAHLDEEEFHKTMLEMWQAISGDDLQAAFDSCGRIFYTTMMMYKKADWSWKIPGIGQALGLVKNKSVIEMIYGNIHGEAFGPNKLLKNIHKAEEMRYLLNSVVNPLTGERDYWTEWDAHLMEKRLGGTIPNAVYEMATQALMAIIAITIWRAMTAESEDDSASGGGGGGHGGHH